MSKKLAKLKQITGKTLEPKYKPTTIDQVLGENMTAKYHTTDLSVYESYLNELDKVDLFGHATALGVFPHENRDRLTKILINEFQKVSNSYRIPENKEKPIRPTPEILKIMQEGR